MTFEAGVIGGLYFVGYVSAVLVLVSLTDRFDPRIVYVFSALAAAALENEELLNQEGDRVDDVQRQLAALPTDRDGPGAVEQDVDVTELLRMDSGEP